MGPDRGNRLRDQRALPPAGLDPGCHNTVAGQEELRPGPADWRRNRDRGPVDHETGEPRPGLPGSVTRALAERGPRWTLWRSTGPRTGGSARCAIVLPRWSGRRPAPARASPRGVTAAWWSTCGAVTPTLSGAGHGRPTAWSSR